MAALAALFALLAAESVARRHAGDLLLVADGRRYATRPGAWGTNARGFHERDLPEAPAPGVRRVVVLGDSMTWGLGGPADAWTRHAEAALGPGWELVNLSHYGYDAAQSAAVLARDGWSHRPDAVVFAAYGNDLVPTRLITVGTPPWPAWVGAEGRLPAALRARSVLARFVEGAVASRSYREVEEPEAFDAALAAMADAARAHGVPLVVVGLAPHVLADPDLAACDGRAGAPGRCAEALARHQRLADRVAAAGLPWWDALPALRASGHPAFFAEGSRDWEHPDPAGHAVIGAAVAPWLAERLGPR